MNSVLRTSPYMRARVSLRKMPGGGLSGLLHSQPFQAGPDRLLEASDQFALPSVGRGWGAGCVWTGNAIEFLNLYFFDDWQD